MSPLRIDPLTSFTPRERVTYRVTIPAAVGAFGVFLGGAAADVPALSYGGLGAMAASYATAFVVRRRVRRRVDAARLAELDARRVALEERYATRRAEIRELHGRVFGDDSPDDADVLRLGHLLDEVWEEDDRP